MHDQPKDPELTWRDDHVPVATAFDDPYFSLANGAAETRHVFLGGNDLPARLGDGFRIAELGFGTGLNLAVLLDAWRQTGRNGQIHFTSFEAYPMSHGQAKQALDAFPDLKPATDAVLQGFETQPFDLTQPEIKAQVILGDARQTVAKWPDQADAWFLDGFSPAKNPELWGAGLMADVFAHTAPGGTLATYSAAGHVRQKLQDVGFVVERIKGFGHKRHMTIARKP